MKLKNILIPILISFTIIITCQSNYAKNQKAPNLRTSYQEVGKIRDLSIQGTKRIIAHITIPLGRTEEEVRATLKKAAIEIAKREKAVATTIKAYRPNDKVTGVYTAGRAIYAPNGKWEDAATKAPMACIIEFDKNSLYFKNEQASTTTKTKQKMVLTSKSGKPVGISRKRDSWTDDDIIANIPPGTSVVILKKHKEAITPEMVFIRCKVRVNWKGKNVVGWVHDYNIDKK
jgi:hypothetical protein